MITKLARYRPILVVQSKGSFQLATLRILWLDGAKLIFFHKHKMFKYKLCQYKVVQITQILQIHENHKMSKRQIIFLISIL